MRPHAYGDKPCAPTPYCPPPNSGRPDSHWSRKALPRPRTSMPCAAAERNAMISACAPPRGWVWPELMSSSCRVIWQLTLGLGLEILACGQAAFLRAIVSCCMKLSCGRLGQGYARPVLRKGIDIEFEIDERILGLACRHAGCERCLSKERKYSIYRCCR